VSDIDDAPACDVCGGDLPEEECPDCGGNGLNELEYDHCSRCQGSGYIYREHMGCLYAEWDNAKL
jgi:RecJ-like exonuclease